MTDQVLMPAVASPAPEKIPVSAGRAPGLRISEVFFSLQGETDRAGLPTIFIRLTGCPLRCVWCDSAYAFDGGERKTIDTLLAEIESFPTQRVCVTGGEPLAQPECFGLLTRLCDTGYDVSLETSGALDVSAVDDRVMKVLDLKPPDSGESARNRWENLRHLNAHDVVKFVVASRADFEWSVEKISDYGITNCVKEILFSPVYEKLEPVVLAQWLLESGLDARLQLQLHKLLWGERPGV
jgi:7-carboxy-7-deazaguanine synthase